jgi:hypothetical protein
MSNCDLIKIINSELGSHKDEFLSEVRRKIYGYISNKSCSDCLSIVERNYYNTLWKPSDSLDGYIPRFIAFLRKKKHNGYELDSALTDSVVDIVVKTYGDFVQNQSGSIVKPIIEDALKNRIVVEAIAEKAIETWQSYVPQYLKHELITVLVHKIEDSISTNVVHASASVVSATTTKIISGVAAGAATIPISKTIAVLLAKHMAVLLKGVIAKILASTAFKTMIATLVKKFVAVKILAIIIEK